MIAKKRVSPLGAAARGGIAGVAGTLTLSLLDRLLGSRTGREPVPPQPPGFGAEVLVREPTGPESMATIFAEKVASGLFGSALGERRAQAGVAVHTAYGTFWGVVLGLVLGSFRQRPWVAGPLHGLAVWAIGPLALVPGMRITPPPWRQPQRRALLIFAAHLVYGLVAALAYEVAPKSPGADRQL
jgi:uncharacterized membrane protein YagU involved in acid resistance